MLRRLADLFRLRGFARDRRGVSAVEFALVAPILILAYLGLAELALGMMASRRASHLAATIGDLAAQSETLTDANITDLFAIGTSMMDPFTTGTNLKMRLTCVKMISSKATVQWSDAQNFTKYTTGAVISTITTAQLSEGESLIMTEVQYDYSSPIGLFVGSDYNFLPSASFKDTFYHHPRNGAAVGRTAS
jgi:Flp pilus assembly protein TadG